MSVLPEHWHEKRKLISISRKGTPSCALNNANWVHAQGVVRVLEKGSQKGSEEGACCAFLPFKKKRQKKGF